MENTKPSDSLFLFKFGEIKKIELFASRANCFGSEISFAYIPCFFKFNLIVKCGWFRHVRVV